MNYKESSKIQSGFTIPASLDYQEVLEKGREYFFKVDSNIVGVYIGPRRVKGSVRPNENALVVLVFQKKIEGELDPAKVIPKEFMGLRTDVHAPLSVDAPQATGDFVADRQMSDDLSAIDWARLHELAVSTDHPTFIPPAANVQDFGDVCVIENDGTVVRTGSDGVKWVDWVRAYQLFRTVHGDDYDFVTFFVDSASGVPSKFGTSFFSRIFNDVKGIGVGSFNRRARWGTSRLQGFHFINQAHFTLWRWVMLQEFGHQFAAFVRYKDPVTDDTMTDHLLNGVLGHWKLDLDDDKSPMGYDTANWVQLSNGQFRRVDLIADERTYCNLDLYLMGLLDQNEVGVFNLLRNLSIGPDVATDFTATPVHLNIQNFIAQEGPRIPHASVAAKYWRDAFIVVTNNIQKVHDVVDMVDSLRLRWEQDFAQATKGLGRIDTVLGSRTGHAADFTIVIPSRQGFGNDLEHLQSMEPNVPFVGRAETYTFSCPKANSREAAVLMFQSRDVDFRTNIIAINGRSVSGGIPVSPNKDTWNGNVMLISAGVLREMGNELRVESRNESGGTDGEVDDFILDNAVVMYKTR